MLPAVRGRASLDQAAAANSASVNALNIDISSYIEIPDSIHDYSSLSSHHLFSSIQSQFLEDINRLKAAIVYYVGNEYGDNLDRFRSKIEEPTFGIHDALCSLYRDTRYQIYSLSRFLQANQEQDLQSQGACSSEQKSELSKDDIAFILHDCMQGIDLCPAGVHSRIMRAYHSLEAAESNSLAAKIACIKDGLLRDCIQTTLLKESQLSPSSFIIGNEVHIFNSLYNSACSKLGLPEIYDPLAPNNFSHAFVDHFLEKVLLVVNDASVYQKLAEEIYQKFEKYLIKHNYLHWLDGPILLENFELNTDDLDVSVMNPVNMLFNMIGKDQRLMLSVLLKEGDDTIHFEHVFERILYWVVQVHTCAKGKVIACRPTENNLYECLVTLKDAFFWISKSIYEVGRRDDYSIDPDEYKSLSLKNIKQISFSSFSPVLCFNLLIQAIKQTDNAKEIADFFLNKFVMNELFYITSGFQEEMSLLIRDKILHNANFREELQSEVIKTLSREDKVIQSIQVSWLLKTPILEKVLSELKKLRFDISHALDALTSFEVLEFSDQGIINLLDERLIKGCFTHAFNNKMAALVERLILTGIFDNYINAAMGNGYNVLMLFATKNCVLGIEYLLSRPDIISSAWDRYGCTALMYACMSGSKEAAVILAQKTDINLQDNYGLSALMHACRNNRVDIVNTLLGYSNIDINAECGLGSTALIYACEIGSLEIIKALLNRGSYINHVNNNLLSSLMIACSKGYKEVVSLLLSHQANINLRNISDTNAFFLACENGHADIVEILLNHGVHNINEVNSNGVTALMYACYGGHIDVLNILLENHADVEIKNNTGCTALICAVYNNHLDIVKILLAINVNINVKSNTGGNVLMYAFDNKSIQMIELLLSNKEIDINAKNDLGYAVLMYACKNNNIQIAKMLLDDERIDINIQDARGKTALISVCERGHYQIAEMLLANKDINLNVQDSEGETALMRAIFNQHTDIALKLLNYNVNARLKNYINWTALMLSSFYQMDDIVSKLLEHGVDIDEVNKEGWTALMLAANQGDIKIVNHLLEFGAQINKVNSIKDTALMLASREGHKDVVEVLLSYGAEINMQNKNNCSALILATYGKHIDIVKMLLQNKAEINIQDQNGRTALFLAVHVNHDEIVEVLLENGANVDIQDNNGYSPLMKAIDDKNEYLAHVFLAHHANVNIQNNISRTALILAAHRGSSSIAESLLENGAEIDVQGDKGITALMLAAHKGHRNVIQVLLKHKANLNLKDTYGHTALMIASDQGYEEIITLLLENEAKLDLQDNNGNTALMFAVSKGHAEVVQILLKHKAKINVQA